MRRYSKVAAGGKAKPAGANRIDDNFLRLYFEQMVEAVGTIHEQKIVHSVGRCRLTLELSS